MPSTAPHDMPCTPPRDMPSTAPHDMPCTAPPHPFLTLVLNAALRSDPASRVIALKMSETHLLVVHQEDMTRLSLLIVMTEGAFK